MPRHEAVIFAKNSAPADAGEAAAAGVAWSLYTGNSIWDIPLLQKKTRLAFFDKTDIL